MMTLKSQGSPGVHENGLKPAELLIGLVELDVLQASSRKWLKEGQWLLANLVRPDTEKSGTHQETGKLKKETSTKRGYTAHLGTVATCKSSASQER